MSETNAAVPDGWAITTVARVGAVRLGRQRSPDRITGKFATKYIRAANITAAGLDLSDVLEMDFSPTERETFRLLPGDVLLAEASGSADQVGRAAIWQGEIPTCCFQNTIIRVRPHAVLAEYALIVFRYMAESGAFAEAARGVGIQHLGASRLAGMPFPLPPMAEQQRIVDEVGRRLTELAAAREALESALTRTIEQDRLILEAAVTGTLVEPEATLSVREGRPFEPATALLSRVQADQDRSLFSNIDQDSLEITAPPGWAFSYVGEVGEVRLGRQRAPKFERGENPTPYLRAANITADGLNLTDVLQMDFTADERRVYELQVGDIVMTEASGSSAHVGRSALWQGEIAGCCFQNTVIRFRPRASSPDYAFLVFRHMAGSGIFAGAARGVGIQHLGASRLASLEFPLPPSAEQDRIVEEAKARLDASHDQRGVVQASLARLVDMQRELSAAAVAGRLVPQRHGDEPAEKLLERLGPPPELSRPLLTAKENVVTKSPRRVRQKPQSVRTLSEVLAEANRPLSMPELFVAADYDRDSASDVEQFYIQLRNELGRTIEAADDAPENAQVELRNAS
ncbi:MAG: restriction endonuclease subunit S [Proteobacteria bacterium]|nr:restriction endonuclease subunit S [Pseudomonadota bacterium]